MEVFAVMRAKGYTPACRGAGGRFQRRPGGRGQLADDPARDMPPRGRADMKCVNCTRKGHAASECRQPRREKSDRLCFSCNRPGHEARACPNKPAASPRPARRRRTSEGVSLCDHREAGHIATTAGRLHPIGADSEDSKVQPLSASQPQCVAGDCGRTGGRKVGKHYRIHIRAFDPWSCGLSAATDVSVVARGD